MCVIAIKTRDVVLEKNTISQMFSTNRDGAGFAIINEDKSVEISKGYSNVDILWEDLETLQDQYLVLHFRIRTSGPVSGPMTHPFVLDPDIEIASALNIVTEKPVLFHNGYIKEYGNDLISDTLDFATSTLVYVPTLAAKKKLLLETCSKYVLIEDGVAWMFGTFTQHKRLNCSNTLFSNYYASTWATRRVWNEKKREWEDPPKEKESTHILTSTQKRRDEHGREYFYEDDDYSDGQGEDYLESLRLVGRERVRDSGCCDGRQMKIINGNLPTLVIKPTES